MLFFRGIDGIVIPYLMPRMKINFENPIAHLQNNTIQILRDNFSFMKIERGISVTMFFPWDKRQF